MFCRPSALVHGDPADYPNRAHAAVARRSCKVSGHACCRAFITLHVFLWPGHAHQQHIAVQELHVLLPILCMHAQVRAEATQNTYTKMVQEKAEVDAHVASLRTELEGNKTTRMDLEVWGYLCECIAASCTNKCHMNQQGMCTCILAVGLSIAGITSPDV